MSPNGARMLEDTPRGADGLVVQRSAHWGYNSIGVVSGDEAIAIDPGLAPSEIASFRAALERDGRRVTEVLLTHSHHDHIRGWNAFGNALVLAPSLVADKSEGARERILAAKVAFDRRIGEDVPPGFTYPEVHGTFERETNIPLGAIEVRAVVLPGHSNCTSIALVPALRTLLSADYLVRPGLPYCRFEAKAFEDAHRELARLVDAEGIERIVPAHNDIIEGRAAIHAAIEEELEYFRVLRAEVAARAAEGLGKDALVRASAEHMRHRRGVDLGPAARQDEDNARRVLDELRPG